MGTLAEIQVTGLGEPERAMALAFERIETTEASLSKWQPESELSRLNARGEGELSKLAFDTLSLSLEIAHASGGAFDPTLVPGGREKVHLDPETRRVWLEPGMNLDLGAIAKGRAVDLAIEALKEAGAASALVDLGTSSIAVFGGEEVSFEIRNPRGGASPATFRLRQGAVDSSSFDQRGAHIVDARTGEPASAALLATVVAESSAEADALSTAVYVLGAEEGIALLERRGAAGIVLFEENGRTVLRATPGFAERYALEVAEGVVTR